MAQPPVGVYFSNRVWYTNRMINPTLFREVVVSFNRITDFAELLLKGYIFYHEQRSEKDYLDEIRLLQETIREERERNKQLEDACDLHKKKAEQYWIYLHGEHYYYDDAGNLLKHIDGKSLSGLDYKDDEDE